MPGLPLAGGAVFTALRLLGLRLVLGHRRQHLGMEILRGHGVFVGQMRLAALFLCGGSTVAVYIHKFRDDLCASPTIT